MRASNSRQLSQVMPDWRSHILVWAIMLIEKYIYIYLLSSVSPNKTRKKHTHFVVQHRPRSMRMCFWSWQFKRKSRGPWAFIHWIFLLNQTQKKQMYLVFAQDFPKQRKHTLPCVCVSFPNHSWLPAVFPFESPCFTRLDSLRWVRKPSTTLARRSIEPNMFFPLCWHGTLKQFYLVGPSKTHRHSSAHTL